MALVSPAITGQWNTRFIPSVFPRLNSQIVSTNCVDVMLVLLFSNYKCVLHLMLNIHYVMLCSVDSRFPVIFAFYFGNPLNNTMTNIVWFNPI